MPAARSKTRTPAHLAGDTILIDGACTEIARRTGRQCRKTPRPYSDRCDSHPRPPLTALTAASARMSITGVGWKTWRFGDQSWQIESWRMYDIIGELRKYANWIGNAISRCRLYVAEVDNNGEAGAEATNPDIAALAAGPLGTGPAKDEALRLIGVNLAVVGEAYIVAESGGQDARTQQGLKALKTPKDKAAGVNGKSKKRGKQDLWFVVSGSEISQQGSRLLITRPAAAGIGGELEFREGTDLLIRCWTPHPRRTMWADSSVRSALPVLRKIETVMKRSFAELDSRLTGAGLLALPQGIDYPKGDSETDGADGFAQLLMRTAATSIEDRSSSEAMVPIVVTVPPEAIDKIKLITFWSDLSDKIQEMEDASIRRLAVALDLPPEVLTGMGDTNHWNAWAIEEATIKIFIEPILSRVAEALDYGYLDGALEFMGEDPAAYTYAFDTSALTVRPDRSGDARALQAAGVVSEQTAREANGFGDEDAPEPIERVRNSIYSALAAKPELLQDPNILRLLGVDPDALGIVAQAAPAQPSAPAEPTPQVADNNDTPAVGGRPGADTVRAAPATNPARGEAQPLTAADTMGSLQRLANYAVVHALGVAGTRLVPHTQRDRWPGTPKHELHVKFGAVTPERAERVLRGVWDTLAAAAAHEALPVDVDRVQSLLHSLCVELLSRGWAYKTDDLHALLAATAPHLGAFPPVRVLA